MSKLDEIFAYKRSEVEFAKAELPIHELVAQCQDLPETRGFERAILSSRRSTALIAEVKAKSPSAGLIRPGLDPIEVAKSYARVGADCLSVLTDVPSFGGNPRNIELCKFAAPMPVLRKDFIYDPYQIYQSRLWGADAILLIVASLDQQEVIDLAGLASELGMDSLVEVHDEKEAQTAIECGCTLVGVNNRDLSTFHTDLEVSARVLPLLEGRVRVSESALYRRKDVEFVARAGADAVLIGTAFCESPDIEAKVLEVMGS